MSSEVMMPEVERVPSFDPLASALPPQFYVANGTNRVLRIRPMSQVLASAQPAFALKVRGAGPATRRPPATADALAELVRGSETLASRFEEVAGDRMLVVESPQPADRSPAVMTIVTEAVVAEGVRVSDVKWATDKLGVTLIH